MIAKWWPERKGLRCARFVLALLSIAEEFLAFIAANHAYLDGFATTLAMIIRS
jgi:hypothetical protein